MASLPPQPSSSQQRRSSREMSFEEVSVSLEESFTRSSRTTTSESFHKISESETLPSLDESKATDQEQPKEPPPPVEEPRKCWICFSDETEDTETSSAWRSPCPCALTAHESCLLDWVADLEAPSPRGRTAAPKKIACPQCKSPIVIARPRSYVVEGVNAVERATGRLVVPGLVLTLAGGIFTGCCLHGVVSVFLVFGSDDANLLLGVKSPQGASGKWIFGLPLVPIVLVLSRATLADNLLPALPLLFLATSVPSRTVAARDLWPPSAAMAFATLPYIRAGYNELYRRFVAENEKRWIKELQPRQGESLETENAGNGQGQGEEQEGQQGQRGDVELGFELNLEVEVFEGEEAIPNNPGQNQDAQGNAAAGNDQQAVAPAPRQNNLIVSTSRLADNILGALMFPAISAAVGALLKVGLPRLWTTSSGQGRPGLLQTRWGRSIVGGCLFVVLKDTLLVYSKYKLAQNHKKRRVVDFERSKSKNST